MRQRGFTLAESLLTLLLLQVILAVLGGLLWEYSRICQSADQRDETLELQAALLQMQSEVHQAVAVSSPVLGQSGSQLSIRRLDPAHNACQVRAGDRLPVPVPVADPTASWNPVDNADLITVQYSLVGSQLNRTVTEPSARLTQIPVHPAVSGLRVTHQADGTLLLELSGMTGDQVVTYQTQACRALP